MTATALIQELHTLDVTLKADGDRLRFRPIEKVTAALLAELRERKSDLLNLMRERSSVSSDVIPQCHIRPVDQWDDCDHAAHAAANGLPLPDGWACIPGKELIFAFEWEKSRRDADSEVRP